MLPLGKNENASPSGQNPVSPKSRQLIFLAGYYDRICAPTD